MESLRQPQSRDQRLELTAALTAKGGSAAASGLKSSIGLGQQMPQEHNLLWINTFY